MAENNASKRFFTIAVAVISVLLVIALIGISTAHFAGRGKEDYLIGKNGDYVICGGERYVPVGDGYTVDIRTSKIIAETVPIEGGDLLDRYFIYGYIIYGSETDDSVIYVHTAESADSAAGYYVKESLSTETQTAE
ncbi:MAG: hypothetical protein IJ386_03520 [Clostridia bacterium]|nr:hypothetical protein [Clostridia bacterium]